MRWSSVGVSFRFDLTRHQKIYSQRENFALFKVMYVHLYLSISHCGELEQDRARETPPERVPAVPQAMERAAPVIQDRERERRVGIFCR